MQTHPERIAPRLRGGPAQLQWLWISVEPFYRIHKFLSEILHALDEDAPLIG
jgi:hypothetical protein